MQNSHENTKIKYAVFDLDGTLLDTLDDLTNSVNYVLDSFGMPKRSRSDYRKFFGSGSIRARTSDGRLPPGKAQCAKVNTYFPVSANRSLS